MAESPSTGPLFRGVSYHDCAADTDDINHRQPIQICVPDHLYAVCAGTDHPCEPGRVLEEPRIHMHAAAAARDRFHAAAEDNGTQTPVGYRCGDGGIERLVRLSDLHGMSDGGL